ncbi:MAG TPA: aminotransferase class I/II-fold pyridoxal phosphate-dependent enzyme [Pirellulaceae bacterium]|nr:aminotransferase class I/II-fold pyridoxal phosphate-dependent enzyme [Pirellulaceae bacterium]
MTAEWIAHRTERFDSSGIRRAFALARHLKNPINLSIGQPSFPVPEAVKEELIRAVRADKNGYTATEGIAELRQEIEREQFDRYQHPDRRVLITSGTTGALTLAMLSLVNPGDEVIFFDPYFVMYPAIVELVGGIPVILDTYPDFRIDMAALESAITPRTKMILLNSPANPTGACLDADQIRSVAELAAAHNLCIVSDEIYSRFVFDGPHRSPAEYNERALVIDGFSKSHAMTGLRVGFIHGPAVLIESMAKLQQFTFVCAPAPVQWACLTALQTDTSSAIADYGRRRDWLLEQLKDDYEIVHPGGAFYMFPRLPWGDGESFLQAAIQEELVLIPGNVFSKRDTHFRISFAVDDATLERGAEALRRLARRAGVSQVAIEQ